MKNLSGSGGHHGQCSCRLLCGLAGCNKEQGSHYYPALLRPIGFEDHQTSSHPNIDVNSLPSLNPKNYRKNLFHVITSRSQAEYRKNHFNSGIGKPSVTNWHFSRSFCHIFLNTYDLYPSRSYLINLTTLVSYHFACSLCSQITRKHVY